MFVPLKQVQSSNYTPWKRFLKSRFLVTEKAVSVFKHDLTVLRVGKKFDGLVQGTIQYAWLYITGHKYFHKKIFELFTK